MGENNVGGNGSIPLHATVVASEKQVSCDLATEAVILNLEDGVYYGLNSVACRVWEMIKEPITVRQIRDSLLLEYEIEEATCTRDLLELLEQFERWKLVELQVGNGSAPSGRRDGPPDNS